MLHVKNFIGNYVKIAQFLEIVEYLKNIEVFAMRPVVAFAPENSTNADLEIYNEINKELHTQNLVCQPGLRYAQADIMWRLVEDDVLFKSLSKSKQNAIKKTFEDGVCRIMLEDIILYETMQSCKKFGKMYLGSNDWSIYNNLSIKAYKAEFPRTDQRYADKEIDMVIEENTGNRSLCLAEIKYTFDACKEQQKWLIHNEIKNRLGNGEIKNRIVLYNGESFFDDKIMYVNIEEYLEVLHDQGIKNTLNWLCDGGNTQQSLQSL